jgi:hypothetical protein
MASVRAFSCLTHVSRSPTPYTFERPGAKPVVAAAGEIQFVDAMVAKHGDDYAAMARDHAINIYQHTAAQIQGKIKRVQATMAIAAQHGIA